MATWLFLEACKRADNATQSEYENIFELPRAAEAPSFFQERCPGIRLTLQSHQQV